MGIRTAAAGFVANLTMLCTIGTTSFGQDFGIALQRVSPAPFGSGVWVCFPPNRDDLCFDAGKSGVFVAIDLPSYSYNLQDALTLPNVCSTSEAGLLGLACHPRFEENGYIYAYYTGVLPEIPPQVPSCSIAIVRYTCPAPARRRPDPSSRTLIFYEPNAGTIHLGGWLEFGPDGLLYCAIGERGTAANAQSLSNARGKIIRLDVDHDDFPLDPNRNYAIPAANPYAAGGGLGEILYWGLRNPFRCGFDHVHRHLFIGDVGQSSREEISAVSIDGTGANLGWPCFEGTMQWNTSTNCGPTNELTYPIIEYRPIDLPPLFRRGSSVISGGAYTGCAIPAFRHRVVFTDYTWSMGFYSFQYTDGIASDIQLHTFPELGSGTTGFARDGKGEIYVLTGSGFFKLIPATPQSADFNHDGAVNTPDLTFLLARFGQPATPGSLAAPADFNTDGTINTPDLTYFLARFATTCP